MLGVSLRDYQERAVSQTLLALHDCRSALIVSPTGTGKTVMMGALASRFRPASHQLPSRVLCLAHREELVRQNARMLQLMTGLDVGIEMAGEYADDRQEIVSGTIQTIRSAARLSRLDPESFGLVFIDEAHHATAGTYKKILSSFGHAKAVGFTATPDRADKQALGAVFDRCTFDYSIRDAIGDGWLVPIVQQFVHVDKISFENISRLKGDLNPIELAAVMAQETVVHGLAQAILKYAGDRTSLIFASSVQHAHLLADVLNRRSPSCAASLDGTSLRQRRSRTLSRVKSGQIQYLCNYGLFTEGWDEARISCVVMGRPTLSRSLYEQMVGRGTRKMGGKLDLLVLDVDTQNCKRHKLISCADVLGGKDADPAVVRLAGKAMADSKAPEDVMKALSEAEKIAHAVEMERRRKLQAEAEFVREQVDPFGERDKYFGKGPGQFRPPTYKQVKYLLRLGINPEGITFRCAQGIIIKSIKDRKKLPATEKQKLLLLNRGLWYDGMTRSEASEEIDRLVNHVEDR